MTTPACHVTKIGRDSSFNWDPILTVKLELAIAASAFAVFGVGKACKVPILGIFTA